MEVAGGRAAVVQPPRALVPTPARHQRQRRQTHAATRSRRRHAPARRCSASNSRHLHPVTTYRAVARLLLAVSHLSQTPPAIAAMSATRFIR